jgi:hypothetical protein
MAIEPRRGFGPLVKAVRRPVEKVLGQALANLDRRLADAAAALGGPETHPPSA